MNNLQSARLFFDQTTDVAIWYTEYEGHDEAIRYVNKAFSETFGISVEQILAKEKYHLVNPSDTPADVIERYKEEDLAAMNTGIFLSRNSIAPDKDIEVVKLRFDRGMLGLFKIVESKTNSSKLSLRDMAPEIQIVVQKIACGAGAPPACFP